MPGSGFLVTDFFIDFAMLACTQLSFGSLRLGRLLCASALLTVCTMLSFLLPARCTTLLHLPVFLLAAYTATGERRAGRILEAAACMFCTGAAAAGFVSLGGRQVLPTALAGTCLLLVLLRRRRHENYRWNIEVYVEKDGLHASFPALVDTGNRLREPVSRLPVLIAEAGAMPRIASYINTLPPDRLRTLPYGVLGSTGEISCFMPDRVEILLPGAGCTAAPD